MSETIGRYRITARLGEGRLGVVYKAYDPETQRPIALRVITQAAPEDLVLSKRFAALHGTLRAAAMLDHPNIAAVFDHGEADVARPACSTNGQSRVFYIANAWVDGESLASRLPAGTAVGPNLARRWLTQVLLALDHAHGRGVVHADLKPANVLVTAGDEIWLTDFGLYCGHAPGTSGDDSFLDTPSYLAPEQLCGDTVDARSDLFAAGVLLVQMVTGRPPFLGGAAAVMEQMLTRDPPLPSQLRPGLGTAFDGIVARALARRPEDRFVSAQEFLMAMNRATFEHAAPSAAEAAAGGRAAAVQPVSVSQADPIEGWKETAAGPLAAALAHAVGPIAQILVRNALANAASFDAACAELAAKIPEPKARQVFIAAADRSHPPRAAPEVLRAAQAPAEPQLSSESAAPSPSACIDRATLKLATARLSDDVGPMARIIVTRSASQAHSRAEFIRMLAAWIPTPLQQQRFMREFGVGE